MASSSRRHGSGRMRDVVPIEFTVSQLEQYTNEFNTEIGNGADTVVYKGDRYGQLIAVKKMRKTTKNIQHWTMEKQALSTCRHENIIKFLGYGEDETQLYIVTQYVKGPKGFEDLNWEETIKVLKGVSLALQHVHKHSIIHCDVKLDNILLDEGLNAKLCDFGLSTTRGKTQDGGTVGYQSEEAVLLRDAEPSSDVYSLGVVMLRLILKEFEIEKRPEEMLSVLRRKRRVHKSIRPHNIRDEDKIIDLVLRSTIYDAIKARARPKLEELIAFLETQTK